MERERDREAPEERGEDEAEGWTEVPPPPAALDVEDVVPATGDDESQSEERLVDWSGQPGSPSALRLAADRRPL